MSEVKAGDQVVLRYRAMAGSSLVASSDDDGELAIQAGGNDVIAGVSQGVIGMRVGELKTLKLSPEQAFGVAGTPVERSVEARRLPAHIKVGDLLRISIEGMAAQLWVIAAERDGWRLSTEHAFCGQHIDVHIEVVSRVAR